MLYHVSAITGLKTLKPQISSHGKPYVYAIENRVTALLFGAPKDDFDFLMDEKAGMPVLYECYGGAFERIYTGCRCSLYEVEEEGFQRGITGWPPELVNPNEVSIQRELIIEDLYFVLLEEIRQNRLCLHRFNGETSYKAMISEHIVDRLIRFHKLDSIKDDERMERYFNGLIKMLHETMSGKYL